MQKPAKVNYELLREDHPAYRRLDSTRRKWHQELEGARIALAWRKNIKADKDGLLALGKCVKISVLQKELAQFDFNAGACGPNVSAEVVAPR